MNIGLEKMAQSTPGISYSQLANAKQWRFYKALTRAQSVLVNYQLKLPVADFWGEGKPLLQTECASQWASQL